jgi:hypothetical protein
MIFTLLSCKINVHDAAIELADKKCKLVFANKEYKRIHEEYMTLLSRHSIGGTDTSHTVLNADEYLKLEKEMTDRQEKLTDEMKTLNEDILKLDKKYYDKFNEREMVDLNREVKILSAQCNH